METSFENQSNSVAKPSILSEPEVKLHEQVIDKLGRSYGTGKRKCSIARVWIKRGAGKFIVNGRAAQEYLQTNTHLIEALRPLILTDMRDQFDIFCKVVGGGLTGQAGAIRHGISKALKNFNPSVGPDLKRNGLLTRDSRIVERKKYGRHKARKSTQFSKR
jgi:small subunit ribosomal protein S9